MVKSNFIAQGSELDKERHTQCEKRSTWTDEQERTVQSSEICNKRQGKKRVIPDIEATKTLHKGESQKKS